MPLFAQIDLEAFQPGMEGELNVFAGGEERTIVVRLFGPDK